MMKKLMLLALCVALASGVVMAADEADKKETKWYDKMDLYGDLRLRLEHFKWDDHYDDGERQRFRFRFRVGFRTQIRDNLQVGFQVVSGNPQNPISDNQSLDDGFDKKTIAISEAYAKWKATKFFGVTAGKFRPKGIWSAADFEWDDDLAVDGFMESFQWKWDGAVKELNANVWQLIMNESASGPESFFFGGQVAPTFDLSEKNDLIVGASYEHLENPTDVARLYFDGDLEIDSGYVTNLVDVDTLELVSDFRIGSLFAVWKNKSIKRWPITLTGFYYKNFGAKDADGVILPAPDPGDVVDREPLVTGNSADNDTSYFFRFQIGDYKRPGQMTFRFSRYYSRPDGQFFAYAQSDTRRASNVDGYRADFRIGMPSRGYINVTWYHTDWLIGDDTAMDRFQFDYIFRF